MWEVSIYLCHAKSYENDTKCNMMKSSSYGNTRYIEADFFTVRKTSGRRKSKMRSLSGRRSRQTASWIEVEDEWLTAFIKYAIEGYQVDAIRYLLKTDPKYRELIIESLDAVFEKINYKPKEVMFKFREGSRSINLDKLLYTESSLHTLTFLWKMVINTPCMAR